MAENQEKEQGEKNNVDHKTEKIVINAIIRKQVVFATQSTMGGPWEGT